MTGQMVRLHLPALLFLACLAVPPPQPAAAQGRDTSPSGRELQEAYPLHPSPEPGVGEAARPVPAETAEPSGRPEAAQSSSSTIRLVTAAVLAVLAFAGGFALALRPLRRRSRSNSQSTAARVAIASTNGRGAQQTTAARGSRASPPAARRAWTAEIEWHQAAGDSCFRVIARPAEGVGTAVVAESPQVEWPPAGAAALAAMTAAAEDLETRLVAAGWRPLPPGDGWYAKRFAWEPVASMAAAPGRFERGTAWPEGAEKLWRCELELVDGRAESRFQAVVRRPGARHGRAIGASGDARGLATALLAAGWEPAGWGASWYSERFVWRRELSPADQIEPISPQTERAR